MAITGWTYPATETITGSTTISQTDNKLQNAMNDFTAYVNGTGTYTGTGFVYEFNAQLAAQDATVTSSIAGWQTDVDNAIATFGTTYYNKTELDGGQLDNRYFTETELSTTGVLDSRYYTESELDAGQLDNRYFTETEITTNYYTKTTVDSTFTNYYTKTTIDSTLTGYYTQAQVNAGFYSQTYLDGIHSGFTTSIDGKLATSATAANSSLLNGSTEAQVVSSAVTEARTFLPSHKTTTAAAIEGSGKFQSIDYTYNTGLDLSSFITTAGRTLRIEGFVRTSMSGTCIPAIRMYTSTGAAFEYISDLGHNSDLDVTSTTGKIQNDFYVSFEVSESVLYNSGTKKGNMVFYDTASINNTADSICRCYGFKVTEV